MTETSAPANSVPNSITQVGITMRYTFLDYLRSRRFAILLGIMLLISAILTVVVAHYRPASFVSSGTLSFYSGWWGMSATFIVILSGIFFGGDAISGEFQNKTGYFTLPNPIRRSSVYVGKWISAFIASSIVLFIFAVITIANEFSVLRAEHSLAIRRVIPLRLVLPHGCPRLHILLQLSLQEHFLLYPSHRHPVPLRVHADRDPRLCPRTDRAMVHPDIRLRDNRQRPRLPLSSTRRDSSVAFRSVAVSLPLP